MFHRVNHGRKPSWSHIIRMDESSWARQFVLYRCLTGWWRRQFDHEWFNSILVLKHQPSSSGRWLLVSPLTTWPFGCSNYLRAPGDTPWGQRHQADVQQQLEEAGCSFCWSWDLITRTACRLRELWIFGRLKTILCGWFLWLATDCWLITDWLINGSWLVTGWWFATGGQRLTH